MTILRPIKEVEVNFYEGTKEQPVDRRIVKDLPWVLVADFRGGKALPGFRRGDRPADLLDDMRQRLERCFFASFFRFHTRLCSGKVSFITVPSPSFDSTST